jgi:hypothetical protein
MRAPLKPESYTTVSPDLIVESASHANVFFIAAVDAEEFRSRTSSAKSAHAPKRRQSQAQVSAEDLARKCAYTPENRERIDRKTCNRGV